jgi:hypothetical protein
MLGREVGGQNDALVFLHKFASYLLASHDLPSVTPKSRFPFFLLHLPPLASFVPHSCFPSARVVSPQFAPSPLPSWCEDASPGSEGGPRESRLVTTCSTSL